MAALHMLATGHIRDGEIHWQIAPLPAPSETLQPDALPDDIAAMHAMLDGLQAGTLQPTLKLTDADLEAFDEARIGEWEASPWR